MSTIIERLRSRESKVKVEKIQLIIVYHSQREKEQKVVARNRKLLNGNYPGLVFDNKETLK